MSNFWDLRYQTDEYVYGREPNDFFASQLAGLTPGKLLLPGEGEGRNAVHAAGKGWKVDAFDQSHVGKAKALALASDLQKFIHYSVCPLEDFSFLENHYDAVAILYFHASPKDRLLLHKSVFESLAPGGTLIVEAFHKEQLQYNTGGPKSLDMLFDEHMLASDFARFETRLLEKQEVELKEGSFHQGQASVIRYIGIKPQ